MMKLTSRQIEEYQEQGFVKLEGVLDESWVALLQRAIERIENEADTQPRIANLSAMKDMADAGQPTSTDRPRLSVGLRYTGDDVTYHLPPGLPPDSTPIADYLQDGAPLSGPLFPRIWPLASES